MGVPDSSTRRLQGRLSRARLVKVESFLRRWAFDNTAGNSTAHAERSLISQGECMHCQGPAVRTSCLEDERVALAAAMIVAPPAGPLKIHIQPQPVP